MNFTANVLTGIVTLIVAFCKYLLNGFKKGQGLSKIQIIARLLLLIVALLPVAAISADGLSDSPISGIGSELSVRNVALEMLNVGIEEYNRALFDASEKTLLKAQQFKKYLTEAEVSRLSRYLRQASVAAVKRKEVLGHIRQAEKLLSENQFLKSRSHLLAVRNSELLTSVDYDIVEKGIDKLNKLLAEQEKQFQDIYQQSVLLYEQGQLEAARAGFIRVALYGLLPLFPDQVPEEYIAKIDGVLGKTVSPLMTTEGLFSQSFQSILITNGSLFDETSRYKMFPGTESKLLTEEPPEITPARKSLVQSYVNAVVTSSVAKARDYIKTGKFYLAQNQIETAKKAIGDNLQFLERDIVDRYNYQLKDLDAQVNDGIAKAFGSLNVDSVIDP